MRRAGDDLPVHAHVFGQDLFFGAIEMVRKLIGKLIHGLDHLPSDHFEKCERGFDLEAAAERLPCCFHCAQVVPPTGNEPRFGDGKMKKTDLLRDPIPPAHEIGKDATKTCVIAVQLLVFRRRKRAAFVPSREGEEWSSDIDKRAYRSS